MATERLGGPKIPFYAPFAAAPELANDNTAAPLDRRFARVLCKDAIGLWLGLVPAPYRISTFQDGPSPGVAKNAGRRFAINEQVREKPFKFSLYPGTAILQAKINFSAGTVQVQKPIVCESISVWFPGHVTVTDILLWINNNTNGYNSPQFGALTLPEIDGGQSRQTTIANIEKVLAVTTDSEIKYNLRTVMVPKARVMVVPGAAPAPSPSPTPGPTV